MTLKDGMNKWLKQSRLDVDVDLIKRTCNILGVKGEEYDACILLGSEFESGEVDETHFLVWLGELCHKTPEEVRELLRTNAAAAQQFPIKSPGVKEYQYRTWLGDEMDNKLMELTTRKDWLEPITDSPFYIIYANSKTRTNRYIPINPDDPAWPAILAELSNQTRIN